jgi:nitrate/TMAO reductase-like tetraheme cytochrome c subunit
MPRIGQTAFDDPFSSPASPMTEPATPSSDRAAGTFLRLHRLLRSNWITSLGAALMTLAVFGGVSLVGLHVSGSELWTGPYVGLLLTVVLPAVFALGLLLVPTGLFVYRRQLASRIASMTDRPMHLARAVVALTAINFAAIGTAGYAGVHYMSSTEFCGKACHSAMEPEYVTYLDSPHNRVGCTKCHVAPTAQGFVESKINGTRQLYTFLSDSYSRPIPTPVHNLVPAEQTCEACHWPEKYLGTKLLVKPHYREDEAVSGYTNVLLMKTGGTRPDGESVGIHWHVHPKAEVEYVATDERRMQIPWVRVKKPNGDHEVFAAAGHGFEAPAAAEVRTMDCNDCHNRSAHDFQQPGPAVDGLIAHGLISRRLPFLKKRALAALHGDWTRDDAEDGIRKKLFEAYGDLLGDAAVRRDVEAAATELAKLWRRNVYPEREVGWGQYPSLSNHDGCFRCHDGQHKNRDGRAISKDCALCHVVLSENEENPAILDTFGMGR